MSMSCFPLPMEPGHPVADNPRSHFSVRRSVVKQMSSEGVNGVDHVPFIFACEADTIENQLANIYYLRA